MLTSRRVRSARVLSVSAVLAALLPGLPRGDRAAAAAEPAGASARLELHALPDCTTREELAARVAARSRRIHFDDGKPGPTLRAVIASGQRGGAVAELQIVEPNGKSATRRISARSCAEATDALALIIALALDPSSATTERAPAAPSAAPPWRPDAESAAPRSGAPAPPDTSRSASPTPPVPPNATSATLVTAPEPPAQAGTRFGGGLAVEVLSGPAPGALPGVSLYLMAALDRASPWSPAAIVRGTHAWTNGLLESGGTASFTLDALTLDACFLRLAAASFEGRACASGLYGRLAASGSETYAPATTARPNAALGGSLVFSAALGRRLEIAGRVGAGASLVRDSFAFSPTVFHRTAAATLAASLGLGIRFP
jgi:hypothetical protein